MKQNDTTPATTDKKKKPVIIELTETEQLDVFGASRCPGGRLNF